MPTTNFTMGSGDMGRKKKKPMDKLSRDSCDALAHGMSYGKWMSIKPPEVVVPEKKTALIELTCELCGKVFYQRYKFKTKYCSGECKDQAHINAIYECRQKRRVQNAVSKV